MTSSQTLPDPTSGSRPILRWAGSKRQIVPTLASYWSTNHERYVEPFCGSSALFFFLKPSTAVLSDSNNELIEFYEILREQPVRLWKDVLALSQDQKTYLTFRQLDVRRLSRYKSALRFLYLNRNCFNGLYRTDRLGRFNVPFAATRVSALPSLTEFVASAELLKKAILRCCDFGHTLRNIRPGDFVYLDPPFFVSARRVFRDYGARKFQAADIDRLRRHLDRIDARQATFVLSFADCADIRDVAGDWKCRRIRVQRNMAGFVSDQRSAYELIISNT